MPNFVDIVLPEQTALIAAAPGDPFFGGRLETSDEVASIGEAFVLNAQVSPTRVRAAGLIPGDAIAGLGTWLRGLLTTPDDDLIDLSCSNGEPAALHVSELSARLGLPFDQLPPAYADWRFSVELHVLYGRTIYEVRNDLAIRAKTLTEDELGIAYGQRLLPFLTDELYDALAFIVAVLPRLAALGGLRGQRRALLAAGEAKAALAAGQARPWRWETEFYDDAALRVLDVDGLERVPLIVGYLPTEEEDR